MGWCVPSLLLGSKLGCLVGDLLPGQGDASCHLGQWDRLSKVSGELGSTVLGLQGRLGEVGRLSEDGMLGEAGRPGECGRLEELAGS